MATNKEIVTALHEYYETRDRMKEIRANYELDAQKPIERP